MQSKLYSFSNFIETRYLIQEIAEGFQITKIVKNVFSKKEKTKVYKTIHATYLAAEVFFTRCMETSRKLSKLWAKAKELAKVKTRSIVISFLDEAKEAIEKKVKEQFDFFNKKLGRFTND